MDELILDGIIASGSCGCTEEEKLHAQDFYVSLKLGFDFDKCVKSDSLSDSVDYPSVIECVKQTVANTRYNLIESLAEKIAQDLFFNFDKIQSIELQLRKLLCEKNFGLSKIAVKINRHRQ